MITYSVIADLEGLTSSQRAFLLSTGDRAVVQIERVEVQQPSKRSVQTEEHMPFKVTAWAIAEDGTPVLDGGTPLSIPAKVETVRTAALAEGALTIEGEIARASDQALQRFANYMAQRRAWNRLP